MLITAKKKEKLRFLLPVYMFVLNLTLCLVSPLEGKQLSKSGPLTSKQCPSCQFWWILSSSSALDVLTCCFRADSGLAWFKETIHCIYQVCPSYPSSLSTFNINICLIGSECLYSERKYIHFLISVFLYHEIESQKKLQLRPTVFSQL